MSERRPSCFGDYDPHYRECLLCPFSVECEERSWKEFLDDHEDQGEG